MLLLSAFGLGLSPIVPGTVASLATAAVIGACMSGSPAGVFGIVVLVLACTVLAVAASRVTLRFAGSVTGPEGRGDPGWVVSDEVAGQAIACLGLLPNPGSWRLVLVAFVLFRVFDMLKPPPVSTLEKLHGAKGILYDDLAAGAMAAVLTAVVGLLGWERVLAFGL